jgi:hypothetical protein
VREATDVVEFAALTEKVELPHPLVATLLGFDKAKVGNVITILSPTVSVASAANTIVIGVVAAVIGFLISSMLIVNEGGGGGEN